MKKLFIAFACVITALCASAEKGDITVGAHFYDNPKIENNAIGGGLSFRYSFTDHLRGKLSASFITANGNSGVDTSLDFQWAFMLGEKFTLYPTLGVGFININEMSKATILFGAGAEYNINEHWGIGFEARAQAIPGESGVGCPITLGVTYTF